MLRSVLAGPRPEFRLGGLSSREPGCLVGVDGGFDRRA